MAEKFTLKLRSFERKDPRLGRLVGHDSRSLSYRAPARDPATLASVRHHMNIGIMDQGNLGSCTGHAGTAVIGADAFWSGGSLVLATTDPHEYAVGLYSAATAIDPWPGQYEPDDTGSDGLSVAKVLLARGLISGYTHATSLEAALTGLAERPLIVGTSWLESMFEPASDGRLTVSGAVAGGHEFALDELDVERQRVWIRNSWSDTWGVQGRAWLSWDDLGRLLADDGDCTILVPKSEPAPVPQPVPTPTPSSRPEEDKALAAATERYMHTGGGPHYLRQALGAWYAAFPKE